MVSLHIAHVYRANSSGSVGLLGVPSKQKLVSHYSRRHCRRHCKTGVNIVSAYCKKDGSQQYEHGTGQHGAAREAPEAWLGCARPSTY